MIKTMSDLNVQGKRVLVRQDLNVPVKAGQVTSTARIDAALPTLQALLEKGARVAVMSHLGRPEEGVCEPEFSLAPVAKTLSDRLGKQVPLIADWIDGFDQIDDLVLLENVRYLKGEKEDGFFVRCVSHGRVWDSTSRSGVHPRCWSICYRSGGRSIDGS